MNNFHFKRALFLVLLFLIFSFKLNIAWAKGSYELKVVFPQKVYSGTECLIQVISYNPSTGDHVPGKRVTLNVLAGTKKLSLSKRTSKDGTASFKFKVPGGVKYLSFKVKSGSIELERAIEVENPFTLILTTDKPLYQPGQVVHLRVLALNSTTKKPLPSKELSLMISDPKGNRLVYATLKTDKYGIASYNLSLAPEARLGEYKARVELDKLYEEKTFRVERYRLPKFKVEVNLPKSYYKPGELIKGEVKARYFFGKPVKGTAQVRLMSYEVGFREVAKTQCQLSNGRCQFELKAPSYGVGIPLEGGKALLSLEVKVIDQANQEVEKKVALKLTDRPLDVVVLSESGSLVRGLPNRIYISVAYPDGKPLKARVKVISGEKVYNLETDKWGFATFDFKPESDSVRVEISDSRGNSYSTELDVKEGDALILRPSKLEFKVSDPLRLEVFATRKLNNKAVLLEIFRDKETLGTWSSIIRNGKASFSISLTPDMVGTLTLVAYSISSNGNLISDTAKLIVYPNEELKVLIKPDKDSYRPGEEAKLKFSLRRGEKGVQGAIEVAMVDEALLYLAGKDPKILSLLLHLEEELLKPKYEVHGISPYISHRRDILKLALVKSSGEAKPISELDSYGEKLAKLLYKFTYIVSDYRYLRGKRLYQALPSNPIKLGFSYADCLDPWGNLIRLERLSLTPEERGILNDYGFSLVYIPVSAGPDGRWGTPDDLSMPKVMLALKRRGFNLWDYIARREPKFRILKFKAPVMGVKGAIEGNVIAEERVQYRLPSRKPRGTSKKRRVRSFFPETAYYNPELITDKRGEATLTMRVPDSITNWKLRALANTLSGDLGSSTADVRVFQPFFIDMDLPLYLTRGDEVSIPVIIYNYTSKELTLRVSLRSEAWFQLIDSPEKELTLAPNQVSSIYFTIKAKILGVHSLTVEAESEEFYDAIRKTLEVIPNGIERSLVMSGSLSKSSEVKVQLPKGVIPDASKVVVTIYPSPMAQVIGGLDQLLRMPYGCFEQTSSVTYPNALILRYLREQGLSNPEIEAKANYYLQVGYQRLVSFEVSGGGFSWFGDPPANKLLTAFGLMEFADMNQVYPVDPNMVARTQRWLFSVMEGDHWTPDSRYLHLETWGKLTQANELVTAFVLWGLAESLKVHPLSRDEISKLKEALRWLRMRSEGKLKDMDTYALAILSNSIASYLMNFKGLSSSESSSLKALLRRSAEELVMRARSQGDIAFWDSKLQSFTFSRGKTMRIETTALVIQALHKANLLKVFDKEDLIYKGIRYLVSVKDPKGGWYSTQPTIQALKAILLVTGEPPKLKSPVKVRIVYTSKEGTEERTLEIKPDNLSGYLMTSLRVPGDGSLRIEPSKGLRGGYWNATLYYYIPWDSYRPEPQPMRITVQYDRRELEVKDLLWQEVSVENTTRTKFFMVLIDVGIPPGFELVTSDLDKLVKSKKISRYEYTGRQVILYLDELAPGALTFRWRLKAKYPVRVTIPSSKVYQYYNPDNKAISPGGSELKVRKAK